VAEKIRPPDRRKFRDRFEEVMTEEEELRCKTVAEVCELRSELDIMRYIKVIEKLHASSSPEVLRCMLRCLRDTDAGGVQYELVEACEAYPIDVYVRTFLDEGLDMEEEAPEWFGLMFQSILNADRRESGTPGTCCLVPPGGAATAPRRRSPTRRAGVRD
jgi:hypothetical protein